MGMGFPGLRTLAFVAALGPCCASAAADAPVYGAPQAQLWTDILPTGSPSVSLSSQDWIATGFDDQPAPPQMAAEPDRATFTPPDVRQPLSAAGRPDLRSRLDLFASEVVSDYRHFYSCMGLAELAGGIGVNAVLANTYLDVRFRDWYQDNVRSPGTDDFARSCKTFGEGGIMFPAFIGLAVVGNLFDDNPFMAVVGDYGSRVTRGYLVGAPPMLALQSVLGAGRPENGPSYWQPFQHDNGVSGHAFTGAVPFITAAKMVENPVLKGGFYVLSTLPAWSRINDDKHYLSQVVLGWWIGYLAASAVDQTESSEKKFRIQPVCSSEMSGLMFTWTN